MECVLWGWFSLPPPAPRWGEQGRRMDLWPLKKDYWKVLSWRVLVLVIGLLSEVTGVSLGGGSVEEARPAESIWVGGFPKGGPRSESLERSLQCGGQERESHFSSIRERDSCGASMVSHHFLFHALFILTLFFIVTDSPASAGSRESTAFSTKSVGHENFNCSPYNPEGRGTS